MAEEEKERISNDDALAVLAKHAASPNDPDDAETLASFNQQVADDRAKKEGGSGEEKAERDEQREGRAPSDDPPKPTSTSGARKEKP